MSHQEGVKLCHIETLRLSIQEHLRSVGEEIFTACLLGKHNNHSDVVSRVFVLERLSAVGELLCSLVQREIETLESLLERQAKLLDVILPRIKLHVRAESLHLPAYEEVPAEQQQRRFSPVQEEPQPLQIKEEQEELLQRPDEADGSTFTLLAVKSECDDGNGATEPVAGTSTQHMKTQADVEDCGTSRPTSDDDQLLLSSHRSGSDTEDSDEWEETGEGPSDLNTPTSHKTQLVQRQSFALGTESSQEDLKTSEQTNSMRGRAEENTFTCTESGKMLNQRADLEQHTKIHTGLKPFPCTLCDKGFSLKGGLKKHTLIKHPMIHAGEKQTTRSRVQKRVFACIECGKIFNLKANLKQHKQIHTGLKPFRCTICDKGFSLNGGLKKHMMIHTGEKPFMCAVCGKRSSRMGHLKTHMMIHTGEKPYICTVCGKGFGQTNNLKLHMTIHTGEKLYTCTVCGKGCNHSGHLKSHMRTHTGEKPYACTVCDKRFTQGNALKRHMQTHTEEQYFTCTVCDQSFSRSDDLKVHLMAHAEGKTL